jgi:hypothetical protein
LLNFAVVIFACELIPAMGAPAATEDLLHKTNEKAAGAHTTASSNENEFKKKNKHASCQVAMCE